MNDLRELRYCKKSRECWKSLLKGIVVEMALLVISSENDFSSISYVSFFRVSIRFETNTQVLMPEL